MATHFFIDASVPERRPTESREDSAFKVTSGNLQSVTMHIPLLHDPNPIGVRTPVRIGKLWRTLVELKREFSGFNLSLCLCAWDSVLRTHSGTRICVSSSTLKLRPCKVLSRLVERRSPTSFSPQINPYENVRPGELDLEHLGGTQG